MKHFSGSQSDGKNICIIGCLHGNERFGEAVFDYLKTHQVEFQGVTAVLANESAMEAGERFIDEDLNRAFPGDSQGNNEQRIAAELTEFTKGFDYVLDLHTTSSPLKRSVAIVPNLGEAARVIIQASPYTEVIHMEAKLTASALIGNVQNAVSLELNEDYAQTPAAMQEITAIIHHLLHGTTEPTRERNIYKVTGTIPKEITLPGNAQNFKFIPELNITPFLIGERGYTAHQGFNVTVEQQVVW